MAKKNKHKSTGVQRSDIPYKDRLMDGQFANIAQHRDHSALVAEEAVELAHAAMKMQRILNGTNPTPVTEKEAQGKIMEEICDLYNALEVLKLDVNLKYEHIRKKKMTRWVERIQKGVKGDAR